MPTATWVNVRLLAAAAILFAFPHSATAAELIMFERAGCPWCARWNQEIAPIYPKTTEGKDAPLRRVDLDAKLPTDITLGTPVRFTPTFVVVDKAREVGRITGYINDESFWGLLSAILARIPNEKTNK